MYIYLYVGSVYSISIFSEKVNKLKIKSSEVSAEKIPSDVAVHKYIALDHAVVQLALSVRRAAEAALELHALPKVRYSSSASCRSIRRSP